MKKIQRGRRVLMGQIDTGTYNGSENRIQLFDGKFTTGYRVTRLRVAPKSPASTAEYVFKVSTEPKSNIAEFNWQDVQEIAWATVMVPLGYGNGEQTNIRDDNMAIEDLYISAYTTSGSILQVNYELVLEKYEFPAWTGAGVLVENLSQAGPQ
tara:strand:- start:41 stop:499 length:459 start_codon:yes stop_codon:yes gene_type:complete